MTKSKTTRLVKNEVNPLAKFWETFSMGALADLDMEEAVISGVLMEAPAFYQMVNFLRREMFYDESHRLMWDALMELDKEGKEPDMLLVTQKLREMDKLEAVGGPYAVARKASKLVSTAHIWEHAYVVYEYYMRRVMVESLFRRMQEAADPTQDVYDVLTGISADLEALTANSPLEEHLLDMKAVMKKTCEHIEDRLGRSVNGVTGVPSGVPELDRLTGGWQPGNLIFTAGRPGMGKTQLGLKFALHAAEKGYRVLFYTLEMMSEEVGERILLMRTPELYNKVKGGRVSREEVDELFRSAAEVGECRMMVDDTPYVNIDRLCAGARTVKSRWGLDLVVVDYLQLLGVVSRTGRNREQEVAECSRRLKALARSLNCPVIVSSQLNRQVEQSYDQRPELKHLRESGAIEQDADMVIMLHRNDRGGNSKRCGLIVAKNRHGEKTKGNACLEVDLF